MHVKGIVFLHHAGAQRGKMCTTANAYFNGKIKMCCQKPEKSVDLCWNCVHMCIHVEEPA